LQNNAALTGAVIEVDQDKLLPGAEDQAAFGNGDSYRGPPA